MLRLRAQYYTLESGKGAFINYGLGGVGKLEGGNRTFWGIRMGGGTDFF